jgi:uncharacterized membrane protein YfcA
MSARFFRLRVIATGAGAFSGLFGVGGGTIIVPLLVLWLGYEQKEATGTSLAAIIVIGVLAAIGQALYEQRISERAVASASIVLLLGSAAVLVF